MISKSGKIDGKKFTSLLKSCQTQFQEEKFWRVVY